MADYFSIQNGETALHKAAKYYHMDALEILLGAHASIDIQNNVSFIIQSDYS